MLAGGRTWNDAAAVSGHQYGYTFDNIGNRTTATVNGRGASYLPNSLNQLTQRTVPGAVDLIGTAAATATGTASVTVNGAATARHGSYFYKEVTTTNNSAAQDVAMETSAVLAGGTTSRMQHAFVPKTPEVFNHDEDGNLKIDGRFTYTWDAENRLVAMESPASVPAAHRRKLAFAYDAQGRRIRKQVWHWVEGSQGAWVLHHVLKMAYDGWNLVAELTEGGLPVRSYAWGEDVSGTLQGAGGVGGLLFEQVHYGGKTLAAGYDLNGNVTAMVDMATGNPAAQYEYGPFGELIRASGEFAELNPFRFSTKYQDGESGLLYYGYRYYNPVTGRWLSRDPIGERGGLNLNAFVKNSAINYVDKLGHSPQIRQEFANKYKCFCLFEQIIAVKDAIPILVKVLDSGNWANRKEYLEQIIAAGAEVVGQAFTGVVGAGKKRSKCRQDLIADLEQWNTLLDASEHPSLPTGVEPHNYAERWAEAEIKRERLIVSELTAAISLHVEPKYCAECTGILGFGKVQIKQYK